MFEEYGKKYDIQNINKIKDKTWFNMAHICHGDAALSEWFLDYPVEAFNWADQYPEQAKAIVDSGNELMNHSNAHDHYNSLTADQIIADVKTCNDKIEALTGVRPTLIRCPFGEYDDHVISTIRSIGMEPIQWDVEALAAVGRRKSMKK